MMNDGGISQDPLPVNLLKSSDSKSLEQQLNDYATPRLMFEHNNCNFVGLFGQVWVRTYKDVKKGQELTRFYGQEYWLAHWIGQLLNLNPTDDVYNDSVLVKYGREWVKKHPNHGYQLLNYFLMDGQPF